jgi:hypothetical protein
MKQCADLKLAAFNYDPHSDYQFHPKILIGKMEKICLHCGAWKFKTETPGMCCSNGKVKLPALLEPIDPLRAYMSGTNAESNHFLANIRRYNSCFQMTSFGATTRVQETGFMPTFKVQGQVYHMCGSLLPQPNNDAKFLQIYFMGDEQLEVDQRCKYIPGTRKDIVLKLQRFLHLHNNFIQVFKTALEKMPTNEYQIIIHADKRPTGEHERCFNAPTVNEVAVVIAGNESSHRDIIVHKRSENIMHICETCRSYEALQYPLMFLARRRRISFLGSHFK